MHSTESANRDAMGDVCVGFFCFGGPGSSLMGARDADRLYFSASEQEENGNRVGEDVVRKRNRK